MQSQAHHLGIGTRGSTHPALPVPCLWVALGAEASWALHPPLCDRTRAAPTGRKAGLPQKLPGWAQPHALHPKSAARAFSKERGLWGQ